MALDLMRQAVERENAAACQQKTTGYKRPFSEDGTKPVLKRPMQAYHIGLLTEVVALWRMTGLGAPRIPSSRHSVSGGNLGLRSSLPAVSGRRFPDLQYSIPMVGSHCHG
jgi:hypothetical protein